MVTLYDSGVYLLNGSTLVPEKNAPAVVSVSKEEAKKGTISYGILQEHNVSGDPENLKIKFDAITSHDLTYVGIIQTARASGLDKFPLCAQQRAINLTGAKPVCLRSNQPAVASLAWQSVMAVAKRRQRASRVAMRLSHERLKFRGLTS